MLATYKLRKTIGSERALAKFFEQNESILEKAIPKIKELVPEHGEEYEIKIYEYLGINTTPTKKMSKMPSLIEYDTESGKLKVEYHHTSSDSVTVAIPRIAVDKQGTYFKHIEGDEWQYIKFIEDKGEVKGGVAVVDALDIKSGQVIKIPKEGPYLNAIESKCNDIQDRKDCETPDRVVGIAKIFEGNKKTVQNKYREVVDLELTSEASN